MEPETSAGAVLGEPNFIFGRASHTETLRLRIQIHGRHRAIPDLDLPFVLRCLPPQRMPTIISRVRWQDVNEKLPTAPQSARTANVPKGSEKMLIVCSIT